MDGESPNLKFKDLNLEDLAAETHSRPAPGLGSPRQSAITNVSSLGREGRSQFFDFSMIRGQTQQALSAGLG